MGCKPHIAHLDCAPVPRAIPITEGDFNLLAYKAELPLSLQNHMSPGSTRTHIHACTGSCACTRMRTHPTSAH